MGILIVGSALWMYFESRSFQYNKRDLSGMAAMSPLGWFFSALLLWIVGFPVYLASRQKLREAGIALRAKAASDMRFTPKPLTSTQPVIIAVLSGLVLLLIVKSDRGPNVASASVDDAAQAVGDVVADQPETVAPARDPSIIPDGVHIVGTDIAPGLYRVGRYWERLDRNQNRIENDLTSGCPTLMLVRASDAYVKISGEAIPAHLRVFDPIADGCSAGTFLVGTDIKPGRYRLKGSGHVYWERLNSKLDRMDNDLSTGQSVLIIRPSDFAVKLSHAESIERI